MNTWILGQPKLTGRTLIYHQFQGVTSSMLNADIPLDASTHTAEEGLFGIAICSVIFICVPRLPVELLVSIVSW